MLEPSVASTIIEDAYFNLIGGGSINFPASFANAYHTYSIQGVLSGGGGVSGSEDPSIIESFMSGLTGNTTHIEFGRMLSRYWNTCHLIPSGTISVVNDALAKEQLFIDAVYATLTMTRTTPYFRNLIANVQSMAVSQMEWTVVYPGPPPFPVIETIS